MFKYIQMIDGQKKLKMQLESYLKKVFTMMIFPIASSSTLYAMQEMKDQFTPNITNNNTMSSLQKQDKRRKNIDRWMDLLHNSHQINTEILTENIFYALNKLTKNECEESAYKLGKFYAVGSFSLMKKFTSLNSLNKENMDKAIYYLKKGGVKGLWFLSQCYEQCNGSLDNNSLFIYEDILEKMSKDKSNDICPILIKDRMNSKNKYIETYSQLKNFILNLEENKTEGVIDFLTQKYLLDYIHSLQKQDFVSKAVEEALSCVSFYDRLFISVNNQDYNSFKLSLKEISILSIFLKNTWNDGKTELLPYRIVTFSGTDHPLKRSQENLFFLIENAQNKDLISFPPDNNQSKNLSSTHPMKHSQEKLFFSSGNAQDKDLISFLTN